MHSSTHRFFLILFITIFSAPVSAQALAGFSAISIVLKADSTTKSVLVSNLYEDRAGDQSPFIGTAAWLDSGKQMHCRSFLSFNYSILPTMISPAQITSAYLVLNPLQLGNAVANNENQSPKFMVSRVIQPWEDSNTTWMHQPSFVTDDQVIKQIAPKKKDRTLKIDVTRIVRKMFEQGNNGFMISYKDSVEKAAFVSQWFASAKNENVNIRPQLVINYEVAYQRQYYKLPDLPLTAEDRAEIMKNYFRPEPVIVSPPTEPVKTPVKD